MDYFEAYKNGHLGASDLLEFVKSDDCRAKDCDEINKSLPFMIEYDLSRINTLLDVADETCCVAAYYSAVRSVLINKEYSSLLPTLMDRYVSDGIYNSAHCCTSNIEEVLIALLNSVLDLDIDHLDTLMKEIVRVYGSKSGLLAHYSLNSKSINTKVANVLDRHSDHDNEILLIRVDGDRYRTRDEAIEIILNIRNGEV